MSLTAFLKTQIEDTYRATDGLMALCDDAALGWKPATGDNWMTTGQLLFHLQMACGACVQGFVTGDWSALMPPDATQSGAEGGAECAADGDCGADAGLPTADKLPTSKSVADSRTALAKDKAVALGMLAEAGEERLATQMVGAPWNPQERPLASQVGDCIQHLASHKSQLFYYLKLQGKPVNTMHLWGMA